MYEKWKKKSRREINVVGEASDDDGPRPNVRYNKHVKDELRNEEQIRKIQKVRDKNKLKNMNKDKRAQIMKKAKKGKGTIDRDLVRYKNIRMKR